MPAPTRALGSQRASSARGRTKLRDWKVGILCACAGVIALLPPSLCDSKEGTVVWDQKEGTRQDSYENISLTLLDSESLILNPSELINSSARNGLFFEPATGSRPISSSISFTKTTDEPK